MPYRLKGILKSPNGQPLTGVDLQFIAQQTLSPVLQQTDHNIRLGLDGSYDVSLEFNTYAVKAQIGGLAPQYMGCIRVDTDTPAGLDLPQLLRSYSQEATAPDYAKMIEGWLKEAKAAADKATAEADRAKSEADRASEISGLETVAEAVGLAATPFPDVWIPFNDSLRMIAGFGRDVKVGSDVVATLVNYERATTATYRNKSGLMVTAGINEPSLERPGVRRDPQSVNLITRSEGATYAAGNPSFQKITNNVAGVLPVVGQRVVFLPHKYEDNATLIQAQVQLTGGNVYAYSLFIKVESGDDSDLTECLNAYSTSGVTMNNKYVIENWGNGIKRIAGNITTSGSGVYAVYIRVSRRGAPTDSWTVVAGGVQVEQQPLSTSYIPTNGTTVTRAADKIAIPRLNNDCAEWYSGADKITPILTADTIEFVPPAGKFNLRNVKGFFTPLTEAQKKGLK